MTKTVHIEGMGCMNCVKHVKAALEGIDGIASADVSLDTNTAVIDLTQDVDDATIISAVEDAGYDVSSIDAE